MRVSAVVDDPLKPLSVRHSEFGPTPTRPLPIGERPAAVIYTNSLLEGSNTFIKSHAEALVRHYAVYAGAHRVAGIALPEDRTYVVNDGTVLGFAREIMFRQLGYAPTLITRLKAHRPKVVHAHFGTSGPAAIPLVEGLQAPLLVTFHGQDATMERTEALKSHRGRDLLRKKGLLIDTASAFIAVSKHIRERLVEQGYPEEKVVLHRNGIDLTFFEPRENRHRQSVIVFVGRFVEKKGARYLIEAARILRSTGVRFELVMIGAGPLEASLKNAVDEFRLPCRFTGFLPVQEVREWLQIATVVAIPSVTAANGDSEGLPTILLEAQAMETPVVATRHSGIPEGVQEGVTAELVDERDVDALAKGLQSFLESPGKGRLFGEAGRRFISENFDLHAQVRGLEDLYADAHARHASRSNVR